MVTRKLNQIYVDQLGSRGRVVARKNLGCIPRVGAPLQLGFAAAAHDGDDDEELRGRESSSQVSERTAKPDSQR